MPEIATKGFGRSASLDAAGLEQHPLKQSSAPTRQRLRFSAVPPQFLPLLLASPPAVDVTSDLTLDTDATPGGLFTFHKAEKILVKAATKSAATKQKTKKQSAAAKDDAPASTPVTTPPHQPC